MLKTKSRQIFITGAAIGLLIFFHSLGFLKPAETALYWLLNPPMKGLYKLGTFIKAKYDDQTKKIELLAEIKRLEMEAGELTVKNAELATLEAENKILREYLNFLSVKKYNYLMGNIISRGDTSNYVQTTETIIIDKGSADGLFPGLPVLSSQGIIIGKIYEVKDEISNVALINNSKCKLAATILNQQRTAGVTAGQLGLTIRMDFIPQTEIVKKGDVIVTSGLEKNIPPGLVIGRVMDVAKDNNELWQTAVVEPLEEPDRLTIVSVLLP